eukprot:1968115-Prymnesium_polylepis.1
MRPVIAAHLEGRRAERRGIVNEAIVGLSAHLRRAGGLEDHGLSPQRQLELGIDDQPREHVRRAVLALAAVDAQDPEGESRAASHLFDVDCAQRHAILAHRLRPHQAVLQVPHHEVGGSPHVDALGDRGPQRHDEDTIFARGARWLIEAPPQLPRLAPRSRRVHVGGRRGAHAPEPPIRVYARPALRRVAHAAVPCRPVVRRTRAEGRVVDKEARLGRLCRVKVAGGARALVEGEFAVGGGVRAVVGRVHHQGGVAEVAPADALHVGRAVEPHAEAAILGDGHDGAAPPVEERAGLALQIMDAHMEPIECRHAAAHARAAQAHTVLLERVLLSREVFRVAQQLTRRLAEPQQVPSLAAHPLV